MRGIGSHEAASRIDTREAKKKKKRTINSESPTFSITEGWMAGSDPFLQAPTVLSSSDGPLGNADPSSVVFECDIRCRARP